MFDKVVLSEIDKILSMKQRVAKIMGSLSPDKAYAKLMLSFPHYKFDVMLERGRKSEFFGKMHKELKEFNLENLRKIPALFGEKHEEMLSITSTINSIRDSVDFLFSAFLEGVSSFPLLYTTLDVELNCVGKAIALPILYSYEHDVEDLILYSIVSTKRFDDVVEALKRLREGEVIIIDEESPVLWEDSKRLLSDKALLDGLRESLEFAGRMVYIDVDVNHGLFLREQAEDLLLEHALSLDFFSHVQVRNKRTGEVYDYPIEIGKEKKYLVMPIDEGIKYTTTIAFVQLYADVYGDEQKVRDALSFLKEEHPGYENDFLALGAVARLYSILGDVHKTKEYVEKILDLSKDDLPVNWLIVALSLGIKDESFVKEYINEKLDHPLAFEKAKQRYGLV